MKLPPRLPAVLGDYELIMSVLTNLLSNAFRYAPEDDTVLLEVEPVYGADDQHPSGVELRVTDRGPGMSHEQQAALFRVLGPEEIGVQLTEGFMMEPEASVSALVFHHPDATYFSVGAAEMAEATAD